MDQDETWHGGRPRPRRHCVRWEASSAPRKGGTAAPHFWVHVYCSQTARWIKMPLAMELGLGPGQIVLDGNPAPLQKRGEHSPQFSVHVCCGQTAGWIKMLLGTKVDLGPGHIVLDGDPAPPSPKRYSPQFSAHVYCGQTAGWIMMPLGMEVCLGPGDIVLDGDLVPPKSGTSPTFRPMSILATVAHLRYCIRGVALCAP